MAVLIGRTKGWMWWIGGLLCAIVFGSRAEAAEARAVYGIRPRPRPKLDTKSVTEEQKKQAGKLVDTWMAGVQPVEPSADEKKQITKLIESFGSSMFKVREGASKAVLKFGAKALTQLKVAVKSKDAEVSTRASAAISRIHSGTDRKEVKDLRKIKAAAHLVITARRGELYKQGRVAYSEMRKLRQEGKKDEAARKQKQGGEYYKTAGKLNQLYNLVVFGAAAIRPGPVVRYGIRACPPPVIERKGGGGAVIKKKVEAEATK
jgi:hypothetical protein